MALSNFIKTKFDSGTITVKDGTGSPLTCVVRFDEADFSISGLGSSLRDTKIYQSRGVINSRRKGERKIPSGSFSCPVTDFSETSTGTLIDMVTGKAGTPYAARVSTTASTGDAPTFDITIVQEGTALGDATDGTITFEDCEILFDYSQGDPNMFKFSFTVTGAITGDIVLS